MEHMAANHSLSIIPKSKKVYLTKRLLIRIAKAAIHKASNEAMETMGYVIYVENGFLMRLTKDGTKEILEKLPTIERPSKIILR